MIYFIRATFLTKITNEFTPRYCDIIGRNANHTAITHFSREVFHVK